MTDYTFEQYKILIDSYNGELSRFYTRLNINITLQLLIFTAIISSIEKLIKYPELLVLGLGTITLLSIASNLLNHRSLKVQEILTRVILDFEKENRSFRLLSNITRHLKSRSFNKRSNFNILTKIYLINGYILTFLWIGTLIILVCTYDVYLF